MLWQKRGQRFPSFNTHIGSASSETSWKTQNTEHCKYCYPQQEILAGERPKKKHIQTSRHPQQCQNTPFQYSLHALTTDNLFCLEGTEAVKPLDMSQGCFSLNCRFLGLPSVLSNTTAFRGSLLQLPKNNAAAQSAACEQTEQPPVLLQPAGTPASRGFLHSEATSLSPEVSLPTQD